MFCIPLLSGIVGVLHNKDLPTGDMSAGDFRLDLTLANASDGVIGDAARTWTVDNVDEMMPEYTNLASDATRMVSQSNSSGYMISFVSLANYSSSLEANTTNMNILIPARHNRLKTFFTVVRLHENIGAVTKSAISERVNLFGDAGQWYFSIGGKNIPSTPDKTNTEAAAELYKALHAFGA